MEDSFLNYFTCLRCGACCRNVERWKKKSQKLSEYLGVELNFPFNDINGICEYLSKDNMCSIYNQRPNVCRTDYVFALLRNRGVSTKELVFLQKLACETNRRLISQSNNGKK